MGALPHVLHHVGPLAGAAIVAGTTGTIVFGLAAFVLTVPLLVRVRRHCGSWRQPAMLFVIFVAVWSMSTWVVGPWIQEQLADDPPAQQDGPSDPVSEEEHEEHHAKDSP